MPRNWKKRFLLFSESFPINQFVESTFQLKNGLVTYVFGYGIRALLLAKVMTGDNVVRQMYFLEDRTPSFCTSIAGTSWRTEEILDDMKKCGHGVQIIQHHDFFLDDCLGEYLLLFPKLLKKVEKLKLMCLQAVNLLPKYLRSYFYFCGESMRFKINLYSGSVPRVSYFSSPHFLFCVGLIRSVWQFDLSKVQASGEVERGTSFCKHFSAYCDMQFGIFQGGSGRPYRDLGTQASAGQSAGGSSISSLTSRIKRPQLLLKPKKKSPGLSQEALDCLHLEVFSSKVEGAVSRASQDLVCLETFVEGDALIHLPCSHNFHSACLDPWLRTCGDCPYCCRTITIVTSHNKASMS
nr:putative e3 ubiquitin-protein ligase rhy1a [Quercus suber]